MNNPKGAGEILPKATQGWDEIVFSPDRVENPHDSTCLG